MTELAKYTPFARYLLLIFGSFLVQRGWLAQDMVDEVGNDPFVLELVAGLLLWSITITWYFVSKARKALKDAVAPKAG